MAWQLSDNGKAVLLAAITTAGAVATLWIQSHNEHVERMEVEERKVKAIDAQTTAIEAALNRKPLVFGEKPK